MLRTSEERCWERGKRRGGESEAGRGAPHYPERRPLNERIYVSAEIEASRSTGSSMAKAYAAIELEFYHQSCPQEVLNRWMKSASVWKISPPKYLGQEKARHQAKMRRSSELQLFQRSLYTYNDAVELLHGQLTKASDGLIVRIAMFGSRTCLFGKVSVPSIV